MKKMIRILEIMPLSSSAMNFIGDQFSYFREHGDYEMHLASTPGKGIEEFVEREKVTYFRVEIPRSIKPVRDIKNIWSIYRYLRHHHIDMVIGHQSKGVLYGMTAGKLAGTKHRVILAHGVLEDTMTGIKQKIFALENRIMSSFATHVLCVSPSVMKRRVKLGIDKPEKQSILGKGTCNGVDTRQQFNPRNVPEQVTTAIREKYGLTDRDFVVGFCGRLVKDKGIVELTDAIKQLIERYPDRSIRLFVIGNPETRDAVPQATIDFLKTSSNVVFTGRVPYSEIQNYYSVMDVFALPSYREGFPTVVLEASAMELPVVVSRSTGCIDSIIENETGVYCDINSDSIAEAISGFMDAGKARKFGQAARRFAAENFDHVDVKKRMFDFVQNIVG